MVIVVMMVVLMKVIRQCIHINRIVRNAVLKNDLHIVAKQFTVTFSAGSGLVVRASVEKRGPETEFDFYTGLFLINCTSQQH